MAQTNNPWRFILTGVPIVGVAITALLAAAQPQKQSNDSPKPTTITETKMTTEKAILAGGRFWGMEDVFRKQQGIVSTRLGYCGGDVKNATYRHHGTHAESMEVVLDPAMTDFRKVLEFFFQIHDPTTKNCLGNDLGMFYGSAIYFTSEEQKQVAVDTVEDINAFGLLSGKVVTEVEPAGDFWEAEPEHQGYLARNSGGYTCHFTSNGWVLPERSTSR